MGTVRRWRQARRMKKINQMFAMAAMAEGKGSTVTVPGNTPKFSAEDFLRLDIAQLQRLAAETLWSSPHAKGAMHQINVLAMGEGLRLQAQPNRTILGIDGKEAHTLARQMEAYFEVVRSQNACSHDGTRPYNGVEIQGFWSWLIWDECFKIQRYRDVEDVVPVSVEVINPSRVKTPPSVQNLPEGAHIDQGIEIQNGKHVAFWMEVYAPSGTVTYERVPYFAPGGRPIGIHVFRTMMPGQVRGTTRFLAVFHELKRIQEALQLETDTMATNAHLAASVERDRSISNPDKFSAIAAAGGDLSAYDENLFAGSPGVTPYAQQTGGLVIQSLEPGEKLVPFDSKRPNVNVNEFILNVLTWIGPAIGIPVELWRALFGKSYSASKGSIDLGYKSFAQEIFQYSRGAEQPYYEATMSAYVAAGRLRLPKWNDPLMRAAYLQTKWSGPPKPSLNPFQEEKAASERVNNWRSSNERETQLNSGTSFDVVADRKGYELERIDELSAQFEDIEGLEA